MTIPLPADFDVDELMRFVEPRAVPAIERTSDVSYTRSVRIDGQVISLALTCRGGPRDGLMRVVSNPPLSTRRTRGLVGRLLDLDTDLTAFRRRVARDPLLGPLVRARPGLRVTRYLDPFEGALRAIVGQQVSLAAARTMTDRLVRLAGLPAPGLDGHELLAFPEPQVILELGSSRLRDIGLTGAKTAALLAVAEAVETGRLDWRRLAREPSDAALARLESIRGIGPWTAAYIRMRALGDPDAFLPTDLGTIKAFGRLGPSTDTPTVRTILARAETWRPWRAYAMLHLWRSLAES